MPKIKSEKKAPPSKTNKTIAKLVEGEKAKSLRPFDPSELPAAVLAEIGSLRWTQERVDAWLSTRDYSPMPMKEFIGVIYADADRRTAELTAEAQQMLESMPATAKTEGGIVPSTMSVLPHSTFAQDDPANPVYSMTPSEGKPIAIDKKGWGRGAVIGFMTREWTPSLAEEACRQSGWECPNSLLTFLDQLDTAGAEYFGEEELYKSQTVAYDVLVRLYEKRSDPTRKTQSKETKMPKTATKPKETAPKEEPKKTPKEPAAPKEAPAPKGPKEAPAPKEGKGSKAKDAAPAKGGKTSPKKTEKTPEKAPAGKTATKETKKPVKGESNGNGEKRKSKRLRVFEALAAGPLSAAEVAEALGRSTPPSTLKDECCAEMPRIKREKSEDSGVVFSLTRLGQKHLKEGRVDEFAAPAAVGEYPEGR